MMLAIILYFIEYVLYNPIQYFEGIGKFRKIYGNYKIEFKKFLGNYEEFCVI